MPVQATQFSPTASLVNGLQAATTVQKDNGLAKTAGKYSLRVGFLPLAALAVIETVVFYVLKGLTAGKWDFASKGLDTAALTVIEAGKSIVGAQTLDAAATKAPGFFTRIATGAVYYGKMVGNFAKDKTIATGKFGYNHKLAIGLGAAGFAALYAGYKYEVVGSTLGYFFPGGNATVASNVSLPSNVSLAANVSLPSNVSLASNVTKTV